MSNQPRSWHSRRAMRLRFVPLLALACAPARSDTPAPAPAPVAAAAPASPTPQAEPLRITYLANEGVLLTAGGESVLIDGLHRPYEPDYAVLDEADREAVERATGVFASVRLVLVSHRHRDHFDAEAVRLHLEHNPRARLVAAPQVTGPVLAGVTDDAVRARVETVAYAPGAEHTRTVGRFTVTFLGLPHGTGRHRDIENFGHLVESAGQRVIHVGDAELADPEYLRFDLPRRRIDLAVLPYWYFLTRDDGATTRRIFGASRYYGVHIPPNDPDARMKLRQAAPDVTPLTRMLDELR